MATTETAAGTLADPGRVVHASREIAAPADLIFELIADPNRQPEWDGNDNLDHAQEAQRIRAVGESFQMLNTSGKVRDNRVVEFTEGRLIAWMPGEVGVDKRPGHLWRWELEPLADHRTKVTHTYDWTHLTDERRFDRARATTADKLMASIDRLAALAEASTEL